ncbi:MAG: DUF192 domain-containing protein [Fimbriimonadaceae bacterium]|nr:DUF192 domain-containing protein [Alphaproteobacteria bacterium]
MRPVFSRAARLYGLDVRALLCAILISFSVLVAYADRACADDEFSNLTITRQDGSISSFLVEFADTSQKRQQGLMFRRFLADNNGMLFDFKTDQQVQMWMKNTYIPLDMIFIRADGIIHRIEQNTEPHSLRVIASNGAVRAVLEIPGGASRRLSLRAGDKVGHDMFRAN